MHHSVSPIRAKIEENLLAVEPNEADELQNEDQEVNDHEAGVNWLNELAS